jgi:putative membrane protein
MPHSSSRSRLIALAFVAFGAAACDSMGGKGDSSLRAAVDSTPLVARDSAPRLTDGNIFAILDMANAHDSAGGALASTKGTSADVKAFGREMVKDHHAMRKEGQDLARTLGVTPETPLNDSTQAMHESASAVLKSLAKGREFDRAYIDHEVREHQEVLNKVKSLRDMTKNAEIHTLIDKAVPKIREHLDKAMDIQRKLGGGVTAKAP